VIDLVALLDLLHTRVVPAEPMKTRHLTLALALLAVPALAHATNAWTGWWRHQDNAEACLRGASTAFATAQLTRIRVNPQTSVVSGFAGEYVANAICIDQSSTLTVAGPSEAVTHSLYDRIKNSWH
jgi:hypothetical protein